MEHTYKDGIIIGAGAAGLMCAIESGKRNRSVLILDHSEKLAKKIRASGGGRCNFTNKHTASENFISQNPSFIKSALSRYTPQDFCALLKKYNIPFHEKKLGQLFCDKGSQEIINLLKQKCHSHRVQINLETKIVTIKKEKLFTLKTSRGTFKSQSLVVATGGLSFASLGATDLGYKIANQFNITTHHCRPGLVPLTLSKKDLNIFKDLAGVSLETIVSFKKTSFQENILFTHKGLSGPAILQISSYWRPNKPIEINLLPNMDALKILKENQKKKITLKNFLTNLLPTRFAKTLCEHILKNKPLNQYSLKELQDIAHRLHHFEITPTGTEGYTKAEVTLGGIDTNELSSKTFETKKVAGLYFIGEIVDVTGHLGGFNLQWAWSSGVAAGQHV